MEKFKNFWRMIWEVIVEVQTARAAEHLARCGRYSEAYDMYLGSNVASKTQ